MEKVARFAIAWLLVAGVACTGLSNNKNNNNNNNRDELATTVRLLQEQVNALLKHRQEDYNALEESLKRAIEKNTELIVLRDEVKQLRKEMSSLRGGNGNEAKNERLRVRWLGSAVTELQSEVAEVLRTRNASEELAERSRMRSEMSLLKSDVAEIGRDIRNLGGRMTVMEATIGTIRVDISAVKERASQLTRTSADVASMLSTIQIEMKSLKCDPEHKEHHLARNEIPTHHREHSVRKEHHLRHGHSRFPTIRKIEDRLTHLEHKIAVVSRKRSVMEKRVVFESQDDLTTRMTDLETAQKDLTKKLTNATRQLGDLEKLGESMIQLFESVQALEDKFETSQTDAKRELAKLDINLVRKSAELSLTREELGNLRRTVQALSVSASKLQEKSDQQQDAILKINGTVSSLDLNSSLNQAKNVTKELEHVEDEYRLMVDSLPGNCDELDGLTLISPGSGAPLLASCRKGWIVVSRRIDGMVDFDRTWNEYASGFGSPLNEFWVGNEALHRLTKDNCTRLKIDLTDIYGRFWTAQYEQFSVDSEETGYKLHVGGYSGNATDAMNYQNGMAFSAKDKDMDISSADCSANYHGGWWFSHCQHANLNGKYSLGLTWFQSSNNEWMAVVTSEMSIQKKSEC